MSSRPAGMPPQQQQQGQSTAITSRTCLPLRCVRCRQALQATAFVTGCNCIYCETCASTHFQHTTQCVKCKKMLGQNEFYDVVVTDPSESTEQKDNMSLLSALFTKSGGRPGPITFEDVCRNLMREQDSLYANTQVFFKQFVAETGAALGQVDGWKRRAAEYQKQNNELKQKHHMEKQHLLQQLTIKESKLKEKENLIQQLTRQLEQAKHGRQAVSAASRNASRSGQLSNTLPFVRRMQQKEREKLAKERALNQPSRLFMSEDHNDSQSFPYSSRSHRSSSSRDTNPRARHGYQQTQPGDDLF